MSGGTTCNPFGVEAPDIFVRVGDKDVLGWIRELLYGKGK